MSRPDDRSAWPQARCWVPQRVQSLLGDFGANTSAAADFLAVHSPIGGLTVEASGQKQSVDDDGLYRLLSATEGRLAAFLKGPPGSGKSHLIRWLSVRWAAERSHDHVLFISREDGTLKATLERLVESLGEDRDLVAGLSAAGAGLRRMGVEIMLLQALVLWLNPDARDDSPGAIRTAKQHELWVIFDHPAVRKALTRSGGPIELIVDKLVGGKGKLAEDVPRFTRNELETLEAACSGVASISTRLRNLLKDEGAIAVALTALNTALSAATEQSVAIGPQRLPEALRQLRRRVHTRGAERRIVLMIEDVSAFTGIDRGLIEAVLSERNASEPEMAPLLAIVGLTSQYFDNEFTGQSAARQRMTHVISIAGGASLESDPAGFAARYLNAVRFASDADFASKAIGIVPSACSNCPAQEACHRDFGAWGSFEGKVGFGLYPFNPRMLKAAFVALRDPVAAGDAQRTPRTFKWLLGALLNEDEERGPSALSALLRRQEPMHSPELSMATGQAAEALAPEAAEELAALSRWWGDGRLDTGALPRTVYEHFTLPAPRSEQTRSPLPSQPEPDRPGPPAPEPPAAPEPPFQQPQPEPPVRPQPRPSVSPINTHREWLRAWLRQSQPLQGQDRWRKAAHKLLAAGAPWKSYELPEGDDRLFPEAAVAIDGQMIETLPHAIKLPRAQDVHDALAAAAEIESSRPDDDGLQARAFFRFIQRRGPEVAKQIRGLVPTAGGSPWDPALSALQLLILDALLSRRAALSDGLPGLLHAAFASVDREADKPHRTLPTWLAASRCLQEKREALRKLARNWLDLAPGETPFLAIPRLIQPLKQFLDELELPEAPLPDRFTQLAGSRTRDLAVVAQLQSVLADQLPALRMEARAAAQKLAAQILPPGFPASVGPRDLLAVADRLSNGPGVRAVGGATLTPLVTKLREAKLKAAVAQIDIEAWTAERARTVAQALSDAIKESDVARRLGAMSTLPFDEVEPVAVLTTAATDLLSSLDQRRRQTMADEKPSTVAQALARAREAVAIVQQRTAEIEASLP